MYNTHYNYPDKELWNAEQWESGFSPICKLAQWLEGKNNEFFRTKPGEGPYTGRTDFVYDSKSGSNVYADFIKEWDEKGLFYKYTEQARVSWMAMLPKDVAARQRRDPKVLVVFSDADYSDPNWAMDIMAAHKEYNELAAKEGMVIIYICPNGVNMANNHIGIMQEVSVIYNISMDPVYIDMTTLKKVGGKLSDIEGFYYTDANGNKVDDPDSYIEELYGIPVLNVTRRWQNRVSHLYYNTFADWVQHPTYNVPHHLHSACGREMAEAMRMEHTYRSGGAPEYKQYWLDKGLTYETHDYNGFQWLSYIPTSYLEPGADKLPVVMIFQESTYQDDYQPVQGAASFFNYMDLAANGEMMLLFFAMESVDDNDMFYDILQDAAKIYPIDMSRVYVTGHSHNGHFCAEFVRRHHEAIAAVAPLGNHLGMPNPSYATELVKVTDDKIELSSTYDMPTIVVNGIAEHVAALHIRSADYVRLSADALRRRLKACRCPDKSEEEIIATLESENRVIRTLGFPCDRSEIQYIMGCECFIGDVTNVDGNNHLRFAVIGNQPHTASPQMPFLCWNFMRRFKRDLETGKVVELY